MSTWDKFEFVKENLGAEELADEMGRAMGTSKLEEILDYILKNWDIPLYDEKDEDEEE